MKKISNVLLAIAQCNVACFGGVPLAIFIGYFIGVFWGLVVSFTSTAIFYLIENKFGTLKK